MRVAVVCEALAAGKSRDEVIALFEGQDDFDPTITAYYVNYISTTWLLAVEMRDDSRKMFDSCDLWRLSVERRDVS